MIWGISPSVYLNDRYDKSYIFILLYFIFELFVIFMVMVNMVKVELVDATENCLLHISFYKLNFLMWSRSKGLGKVWTNRLSN